MEIKETKYPNGNLNEKFEVTKNEFGDTIKDGKYEKWFVSGIKECEGEFIENLKFGYWKYWNEDSELIEEGEYFNDLKGDNWKTHTHSVVANNKVEQKPGIHSSSDHRLETEPEHPIQNKSSKDSTAILKSDTLDEEQKIENDQPKTYIPQDNIDAPKIAPTTNLKHQDVYTKKSNKLLYIVIGGLVFVTIIIVIYVLFIKSEGQSEFVGSNVNVTTEENRKRELELREREIALKEKELEKQKTQQQTQQPSLNSPEGVVSKFIQSLGKQDWSAAFALMTEKRRGSYTNFCSKKGYGGITKTTIYSCSFSGNVDGKKEVIVDYESIDPANKSGRFKQYFYLIPFNDSFLITDIKNINIEWY